MILVDRRFGAELVAGRVYKFDGLDELARFQAAHPGMKGDCYVTDGESGNPIPAAGASFVASPDLKAPMGGEVMAFAQRGQAQQYLTLHRLSQARLLSFAEALTDNRRGSDAGR